MSNFKCPKESKAMTFGNVNIKRERASEILRETRRSRRTDMFNSKRNIVIESPQKEIVSKKVVKLNIAAVKADKLKKWREEKLKRKEEVKERPPFNRFVQVHHTGSSPYRANYIRKRPLVSVKPKDSSLTHSQKSADNKGAIFPLKGHVPFNFQLNGVSTKVILPSKETKKLPPRQTRQVVLNPPVTGSRLTRTVKPIADTKVTKKTVEVKPAKPTAVRNLNPIKASYKGNFRSTHISTRCTKLNEQKVNLECNNVKKSIVLKPAQKNKLVLNERKIDNGRRTLAAISKTVKSAKEESNKEVTEKTLGSDKENLSVPLAKEVELNPIVTLEMECIEEMPQKTPSKTRKSKRVALTPLQIVEKSVDPSNGISFQSDRLEKEKARLLEQAQTWDEICQSTKLPEKVRDEIDSVVGQTRLLTNNKFQQFKSLIDKCEKKTQNITFDDLDGFWEMMFIQVEQLDEKYNNLSKVRENDWMTPAPTKSRKRANKKRSTRKRKSTMAKVSSPAMVRRSIRKSVFDLDPTELAQIVNSPRGLTPASHINLINARRSSRSSFGRASLQVSFKSKEILSPQ